MLIEPSSRQGELVCRAETPDGLTDAGNGTIYNSASVDYFTGIIHELRTPVNIIYSAIQLIEQKRTVPGAEDDRTGRNMAVIKQNCYRLLRLINNMLDMAKYMSGYQKTWLENCNIVYLIEDITQSAAPYALQKGIELLFDTCLEEITVPVDIEKMERIVLNLLSNAIKFTPPGGKVSVGVSSTDKYAVISIRDSGPGIPQDMREIVFKRFGQVESPFTRKYEGSGIGLAIVRSFVELHNGKISINSEEGKGSEFIVEIPLEPVAEDMKVKCSMPENPSNAAEAANIEFSAM